MQRMKRMLWLSLGTVFVGVFYWLGICLIAIIVLSVLVREDMSGIDEWRFLLFAILAGVLSLCIAARHVAAEDARRVDRKEGASVGESRVE